MSETIGWEDGKPVVSGEEWREVYAGGWHLIECNGRQHRIRSHARLIDGSIGPVKRYYNCDCRMWTRDTPT